MLSLRSVILVFVTFVVASFADEEAVVQLGTSNFTDFVKDNKAVLVKFYAPWCGHCKALAPEYEKAAQGEKKDAGVVLARVDCTVETELANKYDIRGYPTLKLFRGSSVEEYHGGRTDKEIRSWLSKMLGPAVTVVAKDEEAKSKVSSVGPVYFGVFKSKDSKAMKAFEKIADSHRQSPGGFYAIVDAKTEEIRVMREDEEPVILKENLEDEKAVEKFVDVESVPLFGPINAQNYPRYAQSGKELAWFAGVEADYKKFGAAMRTVAQEHRGKYGFVWLNTDEYKSHAEQSLGVTEFPALVIKPELGMYRYPKKEFDEKSLKAFFSDVVTGKIKKAFRSASPVENDEESVKTIVADDFEKRVVKGGKDVLLEIYAPWCGHCKKLEPIYTEVAEKLEGEKHIMVAKLDGTANEIPVEGFGFEGFPTIYFLPDGAKAPKKYEGARELDSILSFVKSLTTKALSTDIGGEAKDEL